MNFLELAGRRYSVRAYKPDPVSEEDLRQVLAAARLAPTAANRQPVRVMAIKTAGRAESLKRIYGQNWFVQAPLVLAVCGVQGEGWVRNADQQSYLYVDAAIVMDHIVLAATELGLGTCWIAAFNPAAAREELGLPDGVVPIIFSPLGHPADSAGQKKRKTVEELVKYDRW
ncbi:MAG: nitroreductase family protein [Anaerolineae bacterium]|nr:nitroreductase family protein [Anaerolineae bacterium]